MSTVGQCSLLTANLALCVWQAAEGPENKILVMLDLLPLRTSQVYDKFAAALHLSGHTLLADFLREEGTGPWDFVGLESGTEEGKAGEVLCLAQKKVEARGALCLAQKKVEARGALWDCSLAQKKIKNSDFFKALFFYPPPPPIPLL